MSYDYGSSYVSNREWLSHSINIDGSVCDNPFDLAVIHSTLNQSSYHAVQYYVLSDMVQGTCLNHVINVSSE